MEKTVEWVMRPQRESDLLDRMTLRVGALFLAVSIVGTLAGVQDDRIARDEAPRAEAIEAA